MMLGSMNGKPVVSPLHGVDDFGDEFFVCGHEPDWAPHACKVYVIGSARTIYLQLTDIPEVFA